MRDMARQGVNMPLEPISASSQIVTAQKLTERNAVNAVRYFFERHPQVYLEVDQNRDYGKDAYVDLVTDGGAYRAGDCHSCQGRQDPEPGGQGRVLPLLRRAACWSVARSRRNGLPDHRPMARGSHCLGQSPCHLTAVSGGQQVQQPVTRLGAVLCCRPQRG
jgi:hypothetical protein